jgi:hypothetical protein
LPYDNAILHQDYKCLFHLSQFADLSRCSTVGYNLFAMNEGMLLNNRYQLLERLGTGGMSMFRARSHAGTFGGDQSFGRIIPMMRPSSNGFARKRARRPTFPTLILSPSMILALITGNSSL